MIMRRRNPSSFSLSKGILDQKAGDDRARTEVGNASLSITAESDGSRKTVFFSIPYSASSSQQKEYGK